MLTNTMIWQSQQIQYIHKPACFIRAKFNINDSEISKYLHHAEKTFTPWFIPVIKCVHLWISGQMHPGNIDDNLLAWHVWHDRWLCYGDCVIKWDTKWKQFEMFLWFSWIQSTHHRWLLHNSPYADHSCRTFMRRRDYVLLYHYA